MMVPDIEAARRYHHERAAERYRRREAERQQWFRRACDVVVVLAPQYPAVRRVFLFGSLVKPGRFRPDSDIDVAVLCDDVAVESAFWQAVEQALGRTVDLRPLTGVLAEVVTQEGVRVYG